MKATVSEAVSKIWKLIILVFICLGIGYLAACQDTVEVKILSVYKYKTGDSVYVRYKDLDTGIIYASICNKCACEFKKGAILITTKDKLKNYE